MHRHIRIVVVEGKASVVFVCFPIFPILIHNLICPPGRLFDRIQGDEFIQDLPECRLPLELIQIGKIPVEPPIDGGELCLPVQDSIAHARHMQQHPQFKGIVGIS